MIRTHIQKYPVPFQHEGKFNPEITLLSKALERAADPNDAQGWFDNDWDATLELPKGSVFLKQNPRIIGGKLFVYAIVPMQYKETEPKTICVRGTGWTLTGGEGELLGRVDWEEFGLTFHVFEGK